MQLFALNPNDSIRDTILRHLYEMHKKSRSPKSAGRGIKELTSELKALGLKQQQVSSNLDYLVQKGWVKEVVEARTFTTARGTTQQSERRTYKISDLGIDHLESASTYKRPETTAQINVTNIRGVTVVGGGNVVNTTFTELPQILNDMRQAILASPKLEDEQKLNVVSDIDSLQAQLQKPSPDKSVVTALWSGVEKAASLAGLIDLAKKAYDLLSPLLS